MGQRSVASGQIRAACMKSFVGCPSFSTPGQKPNEGRTGHWPLATDHCPLRIFAAFTVFDISMAMVRGPTPPGTGVNAPATSATSGCTSPTSVKSFRAESCFPLGVAGRSAAQPSSEQPLKFSRIRHLVHANINDSRTGLHEIASDHAGSANRGDQNVGAAAD